MKKCSKPAEKTVAKTVAAKAPVAKASAAKTAAPKAAACKCAAPKSAKKAVTFLYVGAPGRTVALAGCFNGWTTDKIMSDKKGNGEYTCRVMLAPGEYQYKFVVDGEWCLDSANPRFTPNEFGSLNSLITVLADK